MNSKGFTLQHARVSLATLYVTQKAGRAFDNVAPFINRIACAMKLEWYHSSKARMHTYSRVDHVCACVYFYATTTDYSATVRFRKISASRIRQVKSTRLAIMNY